MVSKGSGGLPSLNCSQTRCDFSSPDAGYLEAGLSPAAPNPYPVVVGPPAAQRYLWRGANYPACQSLKALVPAATFGNPYVYMKAMTIPVPLGSTHASIVTTVEANLSGGPAGALGIAGLLQIKRSNSVNWIIASSAYVYSVPGTPTPQSMYGTGSMQTLENLAALPVEVGSGGVPDAIDIRFASFPVYSSDGGFSNTNYSAVCKGSMTLSF